MRAALAAAALILGISGCGDTTTAGRPIPGANASSMPTGDKRSDEASTPRTFNNTQLCALLTEEEAQSLGASPFGEAGYSIRDGSPLCQWSADTGLTVGFQEGAQSANAATGEGITITPAMIAGVPAVQSLLVEPHREFCQYMVDLSDSTLIAAGASVRDGGEGKYLPCDVAKQLAEIIIPKALAR